jgi:membrane protease YdiL (CAAX protease family)
MGIRSLNLGLWTGRSSQKGVAIMNKVTNWVKGHQVIAFYILAFAITWGLGFSYDAVMNKNVFLLAPLAFIAICGPALAGIIVTAVSDTQPRQGTRKAFWTAFLVAWVVSALVFLANNTFINHAPLNPVMVVFTLTSVLPVAVVISMAYSRLPAVKSCLASLVRLRGVWGWSLLALFLTPVLVLLSILISSLLGRQPIATHHFPETGLVLIGLVVVIFLYQLFFFNATGEETGWRGFALPRMQSRMSPLMACLIMNVFWVLWHAFLWKAEERPVYSPGFWMQMYLQDLPATLMITWLYNRSQGSILVAGIAHATANTVFAFLPNLDWTVFTSTVGVAVLVMILADRMWKRLPSNHAAVYPTQGPDEMSVEKPSISVKGELS